MYPRRSSRLPKASKKSPKINPNSDEDVFQGGLKGKRQRTGQRRTRSVDGRVNAGERGRDIIDIINSTYEADHVAEEKEATFVEFADKGLDESDEDCHSVNSSIASGPSLSYSGRPTQDRCPACQKLFQKARRMKAPIKKKDFDNDPESLTCDQWVLIKKWRPKRSLNARGKLLIHLKLVKKRLKGSKALNQHEQYVAQSAACSRPRIFLQRNLRRCVKVPVKQERKKNKRRKRTRDDCQGSRVVKQQRLHSNTHSQHTNSPTDSSRLHRNTSVFEDCDEETNDQTCTDPSTFTLETTRSRELPPKQTTSKEARGFRNLLAQLRSNSSMIVRETR